MRETTIYLLARWPDGDPDIRILGDFRPTESALEEARKYIEKEYNVDEAREAVQEKCDTLPQDRTPGDYKGCYVQMGLAHFDKYHDVVSFEPRDYRFKWSTSYIGRDPSDCTKGYFNGTETFYNAINGTGYPAGW